MELLDTQSGNIDVIEVKNRVGNTYLNMEMYEHDSVLLRLTQIDTGVNLSVSGQWNLDRKKDINGKLGKTWIYGEEHVTKKERFFSDVQIEYQLEEENVLLLDQAYYRLDDGAWMDKEEVLRIDNTLREKLGYPYKTEAYAQPWTKSQTNEEMHKVEMKFEIISECNIPEIILAIEDIQQKKITWNGQLLSNEVIGYYVDPSIQMMRLPEIVRGYNELRIENEYCRETNLEWCYLLGKFGVCVEGRRTRIVKKPEQIVFGDYTVQGFPFYGGNFTYSFVFECEAGVYEICAPRFAGALIQVWVDDEEKGNIMFSPYRLRLGYLSEGKHQIQMKLYGNRRNTFGALHNSDKWERWYGPDAWRTSGDKWSYEYQLRPMGILQTPRLFRVLKEEL